MEDRVVCTCLDITYNTIKEAIENEMCIRDSNKSTRLHARKILARQLQCSKRYIHTTVENLCL